ncbi:MAG: DUF3164 family protein [Mucilaginibacter sp.]|nr:DUF3164 family protein [Mucilaginibacter sp.]
MKINQQKSTSLNWIDEAGSSIPYNRTTNYERNAERTTAKLAKSALALNANLTLFKSLFITEACKLYEAFCKENNGKIGQGKGNATFYNFDRSIKIEVAIQEAIVFDENTIELAKAKLDDVLNDGLEGAKDFIKPLVMDAFKNTGGHLDTKRVLGLRRYSDRVQDSRYKEAMELIDKAIRKPKSKEYYRVWLKDAQGQYQDVQLNFTSIQLPEGV